MGTGHGAGPLYLPGASPAHHLPAEVKIVAALIAVAAVALTPANQLWAFGAYLLLLGVVWWVAGISPRWLAPRALIEAPFVLLAVLLPFSDGGPQVGFAGTSLSVSGLWAAWAIIAKGTLGVLISLTLAAITSPGSFTVGLSRLWFPTLVVTVSSLMLRYLEVLVSEAARMRLGRISRGDDPRFLHQAAGTAAGVGTLFLRSYERGERVHAAMVSRGFAGRMPDTGTYAAARGYQWVWGLAPSLAMAATMGIARVPGW